MILLIAGQKGSGKSEVARILENNLMEATYIAPFAESLKEFAAKIIGCDMEKLDDPEFKKSTLPTKFDRYYITDKGKRNFSKVFGTTLEVEEYLFNNPGAKVEVKPQTVRDILTGLDSLNESIHSNVYLYLWEKSYNASAHIPGLTSMIIPDLRRPKEFVFVNNTFKDDILKVYVNRPGVIEVFTTIGEEIVEGTVQSFDFEGGAYVKFNDFDSLALVSISKLNFKDPSYLHPTERAFDNIGKNYFDIIINNDSNIINLEETIYNEIINKFY